MRRECISLTKGEAIGVSTTLYEKVNLSGKGDASKVQQQRNTVEMKLVQIPGTREGGRFRGTPSFNDTPWHIPSLEDLLVTTSAGIAVIVWTVSVLV